MAPNSGNRGNPADKVIDKNILNNNLAYLSPVVKVGLLLISEESRLNYFPVLASKFYFDCAL